MASLPNLARALDDWRQAMGSDAVFACEQATTRYAACTMGTRRRFAGALIPIDTPAVQRAVAIAKQYRIPLYPISTGHNWGYGSANPAQDDCVVVDLSRMNRIIEFDKDLGVATLEPGVTQRALREYLDIYGPDFLVPVHGGGPNCSLVGNALERGYGITPYTDHFSAVMALEAVLANGEIYRSPIATLGGNLANQVFKWGFGPYLDGIFSQGSFGIVTRMTLALAPRPELTVAFFFGIQRDEDLEEISVRIQNVLRRASGVVGAINLMNQRRVLSMMSPYPLNVRSGEIISDSEVARLGREYQALAWTGAGAVYGSRRVVAAAISEIKSALRPLAKRLLFISQPRLKVAKSISRMIPGFTSSKYANVLETFEKTIRLLEGSPSEIALPLAYWRNSTPKPQTGDLDPANDRCGLIWYAPLVPMKPRLVRTYVSLVDRICRHHGIEPLITLTTLSDRCFDSTVPLLFAGDDPRQEERARACYDELFIAGRNEGFVPYRANVDAMPKFIQSDSEYWRMVSAFKHSIDPDNLISPGRYSL